MTHEHDPSTAGVGLTVGASLVGAVSALLAGVWLGLVGVVITTVGVYRCSRRLLGVGVLVLFAGVVVAGLLATPAVLIVPAMVGTVLAWDVGENAIAVAEQLPRPAVTWRGELLHATVSAMVATAFAVSVFGAYSLAAGRYQLTSVGLAVVGALVVLVGLGR